MLVAPSDDSSLDRVLVRCVADLFRSYGEGMLPKDRTIYTNPIVSGFYNARYQYSLGYVTEQKMKKVVFLPTGASLGGATSVADGVVDQPNVVLRLYYGLQDVSSLPY